jgi:hypothetical protein
MPIAELLFLSLAGGLAFLLLLISFTTHNDRDVSHFHPEVR